jgi:hypothetical protein
MPKGMQPIFRQVAGASPVSAFTFNNLPQNYTDICVCVNARTSGSPVAPFQNENLYIRFNNDSSSLYSTTVMYATYSTISATGNIAGNTTIYLGTAPTSNSYANTFGNIESYIPNYSKRGYKQVINKSVAPVNSTTAESGYLSITAGLYRGVEPITSLSVGFSNTMLEGSEVTVYGISR